MRLLCWNVNGLPNTIANAALKFGSWKGFFTELNLDIVCFQEVKVPADKLTKEMCLVDGFQSFWACSSAKRGYSGVATYASLAWSPTTCDTDNLADSPGALSSGESGLSGEGRIIVTDHGSFVLINVYVPNAGDASAGQDRPRVAFKLRFLRALRELSSSLRRQGREVLLVGDFNVAEDADWHPRLKPPYTTEEIEALRSFTESEEALVDVWRKLHPEAKGVYTVWDEKTSARAFNEGLRIDYIFASPGLMQHVVSCEVVGTDVLPPKWSDHAGIVVELGGELSSPPEKRAPCAAWTQLLRRFHDPAQRSIKDMFGRKPKTEKQGGAEGERVGEKHPAEVPGGSDGDGASVEAPMLKKSRREDSETHARVKK